MTDSRALAARIRQALTTITQAYPRTLVPTRARANGTHNTPNSRPLVSAAIIDTRYDTHCRLTYWAVEVIAGRRLTHPASTTVLALAAFLTIHTDWLAHHPDAEAATHQLEASAAALATIAAGSAPHRFKVGPCPGEQCTGVVMATVRADDDLLPSTLRCSGTPTHEWPAGEWRMLERRIHMNEGAARRLAAAIQGKPVVGAP